MAKKIFGKIQQIMEKFYSQETRYPFVAVEQKHKEKKKTKASEYMLQKYLSQMKEHESD
jgi:hypothetical protein